MMNVQMGSFAAKDLNGKDYSINIIAEHDDSSVGLLRPVGPPWLETDDGNRVEYIAKGRYRITGLDIELTSDDPNAYQLMR